MNHEEKITAYLLNQLTPDESAAFKKELQNNPDLMAEVANAKLMLVARELKRREKMKTQMKEWKEMDQGSSLEELSRVKKYKYGLGVGALLLLVSIGILLYRNNQVSQAPKQSAEIPVDSAETSTSDTIYSGHDDSGYVKVSALLTKLNKFSNAILTLEIKKENTVVMKGSVRQPASLEAPPMHGFVLAKDGNYYVVTNAYGLKNAGYAMGDIIGTDALHRTYSLKLIGADNFYDIAVLLIAEKSGNIPQAVRFSGDIAKSEEQVYVFPFAAGVPGSEEPTSCKIQKNYGDFLKIGLGSSKTGAIPVINSDGNVVGMTSQYATTLFPEEKFKKYVLSAPLVLKVVEEIIQQKGSPKRCYCGIGFSTNKSGKIIIQHIIEDSPASDNDDLVNKEISAINDNKITSLSDVSEALRKVKPGEPFLLSSFGGPERMVQTRELTPPRLERMAKAIIEVSEAYSYQRSPGNPVIRYTDKKMPSSDLIVDGCRAGDTGPWQPVMVTSDLGEALRHISLSGHGALHATENGNESKIIILPLVYPKSVLWY